MKHQPLRPLQPLKVVQKGLNSKDLNKTNSLPFFNQLLEMEKGTDRKTKLYAEILHLILLNAYTFGNLEKGKNALEYMLNHLGEDNFKEYFYTAIFNSVFYTFPLYKTIIHHLKQYHFPKKDSLNPFLFRDFVTNDYIVGLRIMKVSNNKGSDYDISVYSSDGILKQRFPLQYCFRHKTIDRLGPNKGVEDMRVIPIPTKKNIFLGTGTTMNTHEEGSIRMSLFYLKVKRNEEKQIVGIQATNLVPLRGYKNHMKQKNWLPFFKDRELFFIYQTSPLVVLKAEKEDGYFTGQVVKFSEDENTIGFKLRGNTPPILYTPLNVNSLENTSVENGSENECWLYLTHYTAPKLRTYYHKFVEMSKDFKVKRISSLFYFEANESEEFAVNIIPSLKENEFFISYGVSDSIGRVASVKKEHIEFFFRH